MTPSTSLDSAFKAVIMASICIGAFQNTSKSKKLLAKAQGGKITKKCNEPEILDTDVSDIG
jgi:hypothetical protein